MNRFLDFFKTSKQRTIMYCLAFSFALISIILSTLNLVNGELFNGTEASLWGFDIYFGSYFNVFALIAWIILIHTFIGLIIFPFFENIKVLQGFLLILPLVIYIFLPSIINGPLRDNPELQLFSKIEYTPVLVILIITLSLGLLSSLTLGKNEVKLNVREITELSMLIALAVALNFGPKIPLQWAGSVNFQIVPLVIIALRFSPIKTFTAAGIIFGLITCFTDGYGLFAYPLEYLVAFGSVAIISPFRKFILKDNPEHKTKQTILALLLLSGLISLQTLIRFACASIDSYVFYFNYLAIEESGGVFLALLLYNGPYIGFTGVATIASSCALYYPLLIINKRFKNA